MSWDILIQDVPDVPSVAEIPDDFKPRPLGSRTELIHRIKAILPEVDFTDPSWGFLCGPGWSIEFNVGMVEVCESVMLHVRGGGDVVSVVQQVIDAVGRRGIDCQSGEFFNLDAAEESFARWQDYRDTVIQEPAPHGPSASSQGLFNRLFD